MSAAVSRTNRRTGARVEARRDEFLDWITVCETHGHWAEHRSRTAALEWLSAPWVWCEACAEIHSE